MFKGCWDPEFEPSIEEIGGGGGFSYTTWQGSTGSSGAMRSNMEQAQFVEVS